MALAPPCIDSPVAPAQGARRLAAAHVGVVPADASAARMPSPNELNDWMRAVATTADRPAFAALFRHFAPRIKAYLLRSGSSEAQAEELTQETMVALWRHSARFDPTKAQLSTWLFTIARNVRVSHLRRQHDTLHAAGAAPSSPVADDWDADLQPAEPHLAPDEQLLASQREHGVHQALAALPHEQALVLRLSFFDEHPHARIAEQLGIPLGTVKSRIRLAVAQLRRALDGLQS